MDKINYLLNTEKLRFLVVDDEIFIVELLKDYLQTLGYSCMTALNGEEALSILQHKGPFSVVITDICMPKLDGLRLIETIKKQFPDTDIIAMTGYTRDYSYTDVIRAGANDFIKKPFDLDELEAKINRILKERHLRQKLQALIIFDPLTEIFNRRYFEEKIQEESYRAWRQKYNLHLAMIDIDNFKSYNDYYGHQAGDRLLKYLAQIMLTSTRRHVDLSFRYGGDEFAILIPQCNTELALKAAWRICRRFKEEDFSPASLSIGLALFLKPDEKSLTSAIDDFILRADNALYEAKKRGGNQVVVDPKSLMGQKGTY